MRVQVTDNVSERGLDERTEGGADGNAPIVANPAIEEDEEHENPLVEQQVEHRCPYCCGCCCSHCKALDGNPEAIAWAMETVATSLLKTGIGAFLVTTLIKLATHAAGCDIDMSSDEECDETVKGGLKPSSLVTTYVSGMGLVAALIMPVVGAIVDTNKYRRGLGRVSSALFCAAVFPTLFVSQDSWFAISIVVVFLAFVGWFETMVVYAYLPELTSDPPTLNRYTRSFSVLSYSGMVLYLGVVAGISAGLGYMKDDDNATDEEILDQDIKTVQIAQSISFVLASILLTIAWGFLFQPRPPARQRKANESILTSGFVQLYKTARKMCSNTKYRSLQWFYVAMCFCEAGTQSLMILAIAFLTDELDFSAAKTGILLIVLLLSSVPGAFLSSVWSRRHNPVSSSMAALAILIVTTTLASLLLRGPKQQNWAYLLAIGLGVGMGWKHTCDNLLFGLILPALDQNAEFSGAYVFFKQCLTWLPSLVFTILNEADVSMRWSMASLNVFFLLAFVIYALGVKNPTEKIDDAVAIPEQAAREVPETVLPLPA